jgi:hypothetical protein
MTKVPLGPQLTVLRIFAGETKVAFFDFVISFLNLTQIKNLLPTPKGYLYWLLCPILKYISAGIANV